MNSSENNNQNTSNGVPETFTPSPVTQEPISSPSLFANETSVPGQAAPTSNQVPETPVPTAVQQAPVAVPTQTEVPATNTQTEVPVVPPSASGNEELTVINNTKSKGGGFAVIVIIGLIILFIFNVDYFIEMYENYLETKTISLPNSNKDTSTDNLYGGYILIDDTNSSISIDTIKFYSFRKNGNNSLIFSYLSGTKYSAPGSLNLYVELYNSEKALLYRTIFEPTETIEKETVSTYTVNVDADIYNSSFYALIKKINPNDKKESTSLTCKISEENDDASLESKIVYNFENEELVSYTVSKVVAAKSIEGSSTLKDITNNKFINDIKAENEDISKEFTTKYDTNSLEYTVTFDKEVISFIPLYTKGTTAIRIKNKEQLKKWVCE